MITISYGKRPVIFAENEEDCEELFDVRFIPYNCAVKIKPTYGRERRQCAKSKMAGGLYCTAHQKMYDAGMDGETIPIRLKRAEIIAVMNLLDESDKTDILMTVREKLATQANCNI